MILLLGSTGYVGQCFERFLRRSEIPFRAPLRSQHDYTHASVLRSLLTRERPSFVINAAGHAGKPTVDACETAQADTLEGNTVFPLRLAEACAAAGTPWGHVSSGCLYQGERGRDALGEPAGFRETDAPNFSFRSDRCSFYSGTKALTEELLLRFGGPIYIWRLRIPFDPIDSSRNYISKLLRYKRLLDVRNSLSNLDDFVASAFATYERRLPFGVYNLTNPGYVTTHDVVGMIREEGERRRSAGDSFSAERMLKSFSYFDSEEDFMKSGISAPRSSCVLDTSKAESFGLPLRPVHEALADSLRRWTWEMPA